MKNETPTELVEYRESLFQRKKELEEKVIFEDRESNKLTDAAKKAIIRRDEHIAGHAEIERAISSLDKAIKKRGLKNEK